MIESTHLYCSVRHPSLHSRCADQRCRCCRRRHSEGRDWLSCMVRAEVDRTRRQLDKTWEQETTVKSRGCGKCSVTQRPIARGYRVRDFQEGRVHQVEGFFTEGRYIVWRHPLCLYLWEDLQSDGPYRGSIKESHHLTNFFHLDVIPAEEIALAGNIRRKTDLPDLNCFSFRR